jgi:hypothetical protein
VFRLRNVSLVLVLIAGCGAAVPVAVAPRPTTALGPPQDRDARDRAMDELGRRAWDALSEGTPERLLYDDLDLRVLLDTAGATRVSARRMTLRQRLGDTGDFRTLLANAEYAGICLQGAREEPAGGVLGLRSDGWIFDRALVIGRRPEGRRIASWLEGTFVYSDAGFHALDLERVERPRWEHSDLELAPCDLAIRNDLPDGAR